MSFELLIGCGICLGKKIQTLSEYGGIALSVGQGRYRTRFLIMVKSSEIQNKAKRKKNGSITVEAAFVFPVFFLACMAFCYLFLYLKTEYTVQRTMLYAARSVGSYGDIVEPLTAARKDYLGKAEKKLSFGESDNRLLKEAVRTLAEKLTGVEEISLDSLVSGVADRIIVGALMESKLPDGISATIVGGSSGIDYGGSVLFDSEKCIDIVCTYKLGLPGGMFGNLGIPVRQELRYRYFCGTEVKSLLEEVQEEEEDEAEEEDEDEDEEEIVLVTDTGHVYHRSRNCPSLNIRPKMEKLEGISSLRNDGGGKYYPCEYCVKKKNTPEEVYITPDGDRYHYKKDCQGLKRTIYEVPISEVGKKRACKRCAKDKEKSE